MPVERREQVTRVEAVRVNGQPEELAGLGGRRQPSLGGTSRMNREIHVRICEGLGVKFPGPTRLVSRRRESVVLYEKMRAGPSESPCGRRLQTARSCFSQKLRW